MTLTRARWDKVTMSLASCATVPFLFLTMPQIVKNTSLIAAGRPDALAAVSWQGQVAGLLGNMLLLSYFADKGELSASFIQIVGTCATGALLTQMCLAGHIPVAPFAFAAAAVSAGLILSGFRMLGRIGPVDRDGVPCVGNVQCAVSFDDEDDDGKGPGASIHGWFLRVSNGLWDFYTHATGNRRARRAAAGWADEPPAPIARGAVRGLPRVRRRRVGHALDHLKLPG